jgi:hypothetical protein
MTGHENCGLFVEMTGHENCGLFVEMTGLIFNQIFYLKTSIFFVHLQDRITIRRSLDIIGI